MSKNRRLEKSIQQELNKIYKRTRKVCIECGASGRVGKPILHKKICSQYEQP